MGGRRGRLITEQDKAQGIVLIKEACAAGARLKPACEVLEIDIRTWQRWVTDSSLKDKRCGPLTAPGNKFTASERALLLEIVNSSEYRNQPACQIVPSLADKEKYIGSVSTILRILREEKMLQHRRASQPNKHRKPPELTATQPNQVWSWDITYLISNIRGKYFYLYLFMDIFSRKIVGFNVYDEQTAENAASVVSKAYIDEGINENQITLHSDNGSPMKGATMLATLEMLQVAASFSRPSVSNDNPFSEALFKTLKYCPQYPDKPFTSVTEALAWVTNFVYWYNNVHQHSGINFVTPGARHDSKDIEILEKRKRVFELAKQKNPNRWSGKTRNWDRAEEVCLNIKRTNKAA